MLLAAALAALAPGASLGEQDLSGAWEGSKLGYQLVAQVSQDGESLEGVAYLITPSGERNPYHFRGTARDGWVALFHHEGNAFLGRCLPDGAIRGTVETRRGQRFSVELHRP
jgi:hypothetical protein